MPFIRNLTNSEALAAFELGKIGISDLGNRVLAERAAGESTGRRAPGIRFDVLTAVLGEFETPDQRVRVSCVPLDISDTYIGFLCSAYVRIGAHGVIPLRTRAGDLGLVTGLVSWINPAGGVYEAGVRITFPIDERVMPPSFRGETAQLIDVAAYELSCLASNRAPAEKIQASLDRVLALYRGAAG